MFSRSNVYHAEMNTSTNYNQNRVTPSYSNGYNNNTSGNQSNLSNASIVGSYRVSHVDQDLTLNLKKIMSLWGDSGGAPASIVCKEKTLHLSSTQLRIEDYYLIRNKKLRAANEQRLRQSIRKDCFNQQLIKIECPPLFSYSNQRSLDIQSVINSRGNNSFSNYGNNSNNNVNNTMNSSAYNSGGSIYNTRSNNAAGVNNTTANNIFMKNNTNGSSGIFNNKNGMNDLINRNNNGNSTNNNGSSNNSNNIFTNTGGSSNNGNAAKNIFMSTTNSNSNNTSGNLFGNQNSSNNQQVSNGTNTSQSNNIFNSRGGNNSNQNSNTNNANNANNGANIFNTGNNSSNNSGNLFSNNNNNNSNNNNNNNNNNNSNNNNGKLFNNSGNNQSNNLFNNNSNNNYNSGNNLFSGNGSTIANYQNNPQFNIQYQLQAYLQESRQVMQFFINAQKQTPQPQNTNYYQYRQKYLKSQEQEYQRMNYMYQQRRRNQDDLIPCIVQIKSNKFDNRNEDYQNINNNSNSFKASVYKPTKIVESKIISNRPSLTSKVTKNISANYNNNQTKRFISNSRCRCSINLVIQWTDDDRKMIKKKYTIQSQILLQHINLEENKSHFIRQLKKMYPFIRRDAELILERSSCKIEGQLLTIVGKIRQRIINLNNFNIYYSTIRGANIINLTLTKENLVTISWDNPINFQQLDFDQSEFSIDGQGIICSIDALNSKCRVTYEKLPAGFQDFFSPSNKQTVKNKLDQRFKQINLKQFKDQQVFKLSDVWDDGSWSMVINRFS